MPDARTTDAPVRSGLATTSFAGLAIAYDEHVLTPRAWTEAQSAWAAELHRTAPPGDVLEICAGVGHIGLAAVADSSAALVLVDLNPVACELSRVNAAAAGMADRVEVREGPMEDVLRDGELFSVIIADPPWVTSEGVGEFPDDPLIAIDGGNDGLDLARTCCEVIDRHLLAGGAAVLQLGTREQADRVDHFLVHDLRWDLRVVEVRTYDRGVLVHLDRAATP